MPMSSFFASHLRLKFFLVPLSLTALLCAGSPAGWHERVLAQESAPGELRILDKTRVYFGKLHAYTKPAIIRFVQVVPHIPEYRRIKEKGLKPTDAEYQLLAQDGTRVFRTLVTQMARRDGYDLVVDKDAIVEPKGVVLPDLTKKVIQRLEGHP